MDPHLYCQETMAELLTGDAGAGSDPARLQRAVVLSYLLGRRLSREDLVRELSLRFNPAGRRGGAAPVQGSARRWCL